TAMSKLLRGVPRTGESDPDIIRELTQLGQRADNMTIVRNNRAGERQMNRAMRYQRKVPYPSDIVLPFDNGKSLSDMNINTSPIVGLKSNMYPYDLKTKEKLTQGEMSQAQDELRKKGLWP